MLVWGRAQLSGQRKARRTGTGAFTSAYYFVLDGREGKRVNHRSVRYAPPTAPRARQSYTFFAFGAAKMAEETKTAPASAGRSKREAKAVEHFTIETKEKDPDDFKIKAGAGQKMGDVENIVFKIAKLNAQSDELKQLHRVCFGKPGAKTVVKKNLREFSGFVSDDLAAEKAKKLALLLKLDLKMIKGMLDTCDLSPGGTKADAAARLIDFLEAPHDSGKKSLLEKAGEKRKAADKKAGKKAPPAKAKGKAAAAKPKQERAKTAYMLYCDSRREKVKAENPDAGFGELTKLLAEKWKSISAPQMWPEVARCSLWRRRPVRPSGKAPPPRRRRPRRPCRRPRRRPAGTRSLHAARWLSSGAALGTTQSRHLCAWTLTGRAQGQVRGAGRDAQGGARRQAEQEQACGRARRQEGEEGARRQKGEEGG